VTFVAKDLCTHVAVTFFDAIIGFRPITSHWPVGFGQGEKASLRESCLVGVGITEIEAWIGRGEEGEGEEGVNKV